MTRQNSSCNLWLVGLRTRIQKQNEQRDNFLAFCFEIQTPRYGGITPVQDKGRGESLPLGIEGMIYQGLKGFGDQRHEKKCLWD